LLLDDLARAAERIFRPFLADLIVSPIFSCFLGALVVGIVDMFVAGVGAYFDHNGKSQPQL